MYLPAAIRYDVPYETFWHLNPRTLMIYQDEYNRRTKEQAELIDYTAWRNGMYVLNAVQAALIPKKVKYPDKPYSRQPQPEELSPEEEFKLWVVAYNRKFEEEHGEPSG